MRPRDRLALILVAVALVFAALAIGGAPRWAACTASLLGIASATPYLTSRRTASKLSPLLAPLIAAAALTFWQLIPLGERLASWLAPARLELARDNAAAWGVTDPGWIMASYDPPATLVELAKLVGYLALGWTCVRLTSARRARQWLAMAIAGTATLVALVSLVHTAAGARDVYGLYHGPIQPPLLGPLINVNHLAALLGLAAPLALALAIGASGIARGGWLIATLVLIASTLLTGSRGGVIGLAAALVIVTAILIVQRRSGTDDEERPLAPRIAIPAGVVAACTMVLLAALTAGDVARDLRATSLDEIHQTHSKYQVWGEATALVTDNQWFGVGRGAFEPAFTRLGPGGVTYSHVENDYLQAVVDWGVPGAALIFLALLAAARAAARRWRHGPLEAGALAGLIGIAIHDIADFAIELPAVAMAVIATAALLLPERLGAAQEGNGKVRAVPRGVVAVRAALLALAAIVVVVAATPLGRSARADDAQVAAIADPEARTRAARTAWSRHPSDYVLAGRAAEALFAIRDPRAVRVVGRALALNRRHGALHHLAARMLAVSQRPKQSAVEFAEAARWSVDPGPIIDDVLAVFPPAEVATALPTERPQLYRIYYGLIDHPEAALAYVREVAEHSPRDAEAQALLAQVALDARRGELSIDPARVAWTEEKTARHATLLGRAIATAGDRPGAIAFLAGAVATTEDSPVRDRIQLLFVLGDLQLWEGQIAQAKETIGKATELADTDRDFAIASHLRAATIEERLGNRNQAEWERAQARQLQQE